MQRESLLTWSSRTSLTSGPMLTVRRIWLDLILILFWSPVSDLFMWLLFLPCLCPHLLSSLNLSSWWVSQILKKSWYVVKLLMKHLSKFFKNLGSAKFCYWTLYPVWSSQSFCLFHVLFLAALRLSWDSWNKSYTAGIFLLLWWAYEVSLCQCFWKGSNRVVWVRIMWDAYWKFRHSSLPTAFLNHNLWRYSPIINI